MFFLNKKDCRKLDLKKRFYYKKNQYFILVFNILLQSSFISNVFTAKRLRFLLTPNSVKVKNYCVITRRSSSIISKFRLSRCYFPKIISEKLKEIKGYDEIGIVLVLGIKFVGSSPAILILRLLKT